jgi:hypothetical protein
VYWQEHGPNIVFHHSSDPQEVTNFIEENFDLSEKTGALMAVPNVRAAAESAAARTV